MSRRRSRVSVALAAAVLLGVGDPARAGDGRIAANSADGALQVLADLTLIDAACRGETVNFGVGFRFAAGEGIGETTIMPGGARREDFEAALRGRRASFSPGELCGEIAENYAEALPGSITFAVGVEGRR